MTNLMICKWFVIWNVEKFRVPYVKKYFKFLEVVIFQDNLEQQIGSL
jgi:hypothetical protein